MFKSFTADSSSNAPGASDDGRACQCVEDLTTCGAQGYVLPQESIHFSFRSKLVEFTFTNLAVLHLEEEADHEVKTSKRMSSSATTSSSAVTTSTTVSRYDYISHRISHVRMVSNTSVDHHIWIKLKVGDRYLAIQVHRTNEAKARMYYKVLVHLSAVQASNAMEWELAKAAMAHAAASTSSAPDVQGLCLTNQADEALGWMQKQFKIFNPRCYREEIEVALKEINSATDPET